MNIMMIIWIVAIIAFVILELATVGLVSIWFAVGAAVSLLLLYMGFGEVVQIIAFLVVSFVLQVIIKKAFGDRFNRNRDKTNSSTVVGEIATVSENVNEDEGRVVIGGMDWQARAIDEGDEFLAGEKVRVVEISGVTLFVERVEN